MLANGAALEPVFAGGLKDLLAHPLVGDARSRGLLGALELVADKDSKRQFDPALKLHERISKAAYAEGLIFRAFGDSILGFAPALCYTADDFALMFTRLRKVLDTVLAQPEVRQAVA